MIGQRFIILLKGSLRQIHIDRAKLSNTVFLAGSARSGTTWVQNILNGNNDYRVMFEPFHNEKTSLVKNWPSRLYLKNDNKEIKFLGPTKKILFGKVRSSWIDKFNKKFFSQKRLIKDIRTNLMLKWLKVNYPELKFVFLVRHPIAVVNSRIKLGWQDHLSDFLAQEELVEDYLKEHLDFIKKYDDNFGRQMIMWCIENLVPFTQLAGKDALIIFYEDMLENPTKVTEMVFKFLGNEMSEGVISKFSEPSAVSRKESAIRKGESGLNSWKNSISIEDQNKAEVILNRFGLDVIYDLGLKPKVPSNKLLSLFDAKV